MFYERAANNNHHMYFLKKILIKNAPMDTRRGMCICFRFRSTIVVVVDIPKSKKQGSAQRR